MTNTEKKNLAKTLFLKGNMNRKRIASSVGTSEVTLRKWINDGGWVAIKESFTITKSSLLQDSYRQLKAINKKITDDHDGVPDKKLADAKAVIRKEIEALSDNPIYVYVEIADEFTNWIENNHPEKLTDTTQLLYIFIEEQAKKSGL